MPETATDRRRRTIEERIAVNLREMRYAAELSLAEVADSVGRQRNWLFGD